MSPFKSKKSITTLTFLFSLIIFGILNNNPVSAVIRCPDNTHEISELTGYLSAVQKQIIQDHFGTWCATNFTVSAGYSIIEVTDGSGGMVASFKATGRLPSPLIYNENSAADTYFVRKADFPVVPGQNCNAALTADKWFCDESKTSWICSDASKRFSQGMAYDLEGQSSFQSRIAAANDYLCLNVVHDTATITEMDNNAYHVCMYNSEANLPSIKTKEVPNVSHYTAHSLCNSNWFVFGINWNIDHCCPSGYYYMQADQGQQSSQKCYTEEELENICVRGTLNWNDPSVGYNATEPVAVTRSDYKINIAQSTYFTEPNIPTYKCGAEHCVAIKSGTNQGKVLQVSDYGSYYGFLTEGEITSNNLTCVENLTQDTANQCILDPSKANDKCVCFEGLSISESFANNVGGKAQAEILMSCTRLTTDQQKNCVQCVIKNWTSDATDNAYRWSASLGCVDTRMNPFITRLIQIGLGLGSGIAVVRIIQGAFMRQTNDPAKIQEGNEIIISTILGLVVLASALLILRIIGVDILGIFTFKEYTTIING